MLKHVRLPIVLLGFALTGGTSADEPKVNVTLTSQRAECVLGEPVLLDVIVTNVTTEVIKAQRLCVEECEPEVEIHISQDNKLFWQYKMGIYATTSAGRQHTESLKPREQLEYRLRVLYTYKHTSGLTFEKPGSYFLKVVYPLLWVESEERTAQRIEFTSNTVQIRIRPPGGKDAQVWKGIKGADFAYFLQSGEVKLNKEDSEEAWKTLTPAEYSKGNWRMMREYEKLIPIALSIYESYSKTAYGEPLREALLRFYNRSKFSLSKEQANRVRTVLRIKEGLFPDDRRLDVKIHIDYKDQTPLADVLASISRQANVPLSLGEDLNKATLASYPREWTLREMMTSLAAYKAQWIPEGKGYRLIPKAGEPR